MIFLLILFNLILFAPMFAGLVPLPTDALAGAYYPWMGQNWGFVAGIPYKNIALSDVFSQLYPWRSLAVDLMRDGMAPLWNSFSFSGYPLLANWQSAPFYPLNVFMFIFGNARGYGIMVFLQPILASVFMYLFLRQIKLGKLASALGGLVSAYSGFVMVYMEYATLGQIMVWLPLILFFFEKYFEERQIRYLAISSICFFPVLTGGFFQPAFFVVLIASVYWFFRSLSVPVFKGRTRLILLGFGFVLVGIATASLQLLPTAELLRHSIRSFDHNIIEYNYGLLPIKNLITFVAPDFFGNPVTGNYWGVMQYQEVTGYFSVIALALVLGAIFCKKRDWKTNLFTALLAGSLTLAFDNPVSRLIYQFKIPFLSTGYASRWLVVTAFSGAFLAAVEVEKFKRKKLSIILGTLLTISVVTYLMIWKSIVPINAVNGSVAMRNLILPIAILMAGIVINFFAGFTKWVKWLLLVLIALDLGRFIWKFTPFSLVQYTERPIPVFEFVKDQGKLDRVISEPGPILPANTWIYSGLYSPGGYDPLLLKDYAVFFHGVNQGQIKEGDDPGSFGTDTSTRYLNLINLDSSLIDLVGAKYLMAVKYDQYGKIRPWGKLDESKIDLKRYKFVFEDGESVVLENQTVLPRASLYYRAETEQDNVAAAKRLISDFDFRNILLVDRAGSKQYLTGDSDTVEITDYAANKVRMTVNTENGGYVLLTDTYFPGWKANINGNEARILKADGIFRAIEVSPGESRIEMMYSPDSFKIGIIISAISLALLVVLAVRKPSIIRKV